MGDLHDILFKTSTPKSSAALLLVATIIYLLLELGFNARLLDVSGRPGDLDALLGIEQWGRLISGFAVALAFWGFLAKAAEHYDWEVGVTAVVTLISTLVIVIAVYWGEKAYLDAQVEKTPTEMRQVGAIGVLLTEYLHENRSLEGIPLDAEFFDAPQGKAFYALFANNYSAVLRNAGGVEPVTRAAIADYLDGKVGAPSESFESIYQTAMERVREIYNRDYRNGVQAYSDAIRKGNDSAERAWISYEEQLRRRRWTPTNVPDRYRGEVLRSVRSRLGVNVPNDWDLWDRERFQNIILDDVESRANAAWKDRAEAIMPGARLPFTLGGFDEFLANTGVQRRFKEELAREVRQRSDGVLVLPTVREPFTDYWDVARWESRVHAPMLASAEETQFQRIVNDGRTYREGGPNFCRGVDATYALNVPGFALSISIVGAFYHASKVIWYLCYFIPFVGASLWRRVPIRLVFVAVLAALPYTQSNDVVVAEKYHALMEHKSVADGAFSAGVNDWIVRAQQLYYATNEGVRKHVLGGATFSKLPLLPVHTCKDGGGEGVTPEPSRRQSSKSQPVLASSPSPVETSAAPAAPPVAAPTAWEVARQKNTLSAYRDYDVSGAQDVPLSEYQAAVRALVQDMSGGRIVDTLHLERDLVYAVYRLPDCSARAGGAGPQAIKSVPVVMIGDRQWLAIPTSDRFPYMFMPYGIAFPAYGLAGAITYPDPYPEGDNPTKC